MTIDSRRAFLQQSLAALALLATKRSFALGQSTSNSGAVRGWMTGGQARYQPIPAQAWQSAGSASPNAVEIDAGQSFQSILGFGGAFTDASCYLFSQMPSAERQKLMEDFFGASGLRLSVGRTCVGASDYSRTAYSFDDSSEPDPDLKKFSIAHDREYILPTLRDARKVNPELFLFSSPWSPPGWMKSGGSLLGGAMRNHYFASYAQYFVKFLEGYKAEGVSIDAVTVQNEVDTDQDGRMPAALWGQEYEMAFVRDHLGPALRNASLDTKIWILDHNYNLWGRAMDELSDPGVAQFVDGVAWHGYMGSPEAMTKVHNAFPDKGTYWTEGGPDYTAPDYQTDWTKWSATFAGILKNWARCIVSWNLLLDEKGAPNIGPFSCGGVVTRDSKTGQITRSGQYWAFAHYAKLVQRGAKVIASRSQLQDVEHVAFVNPDGSYVVVLSNSGDARDVECRFAGKSTRVSMQRDSIVTLHWS